MDWSIIILVIVLILILCAWYLCATQEAAAPAPEIELSEVAPPISPNLRQALFDSVHHDVYPVDAAKAPGHCEKIADDQNKCPICLIAFIEGINVLLTNCGHIYHPHCLEHHVHTNGVRSVCPLCRSHFLQ